MDDQTTAHEHGDEERAGNGLKTVTDARLAADYQIRMKIRCEIVLNELGELLWQAGGVKPFALSPVQRWHLFKR